MRLGAKRLLVVGLRRKEPPEERRARLRASVDDAYPNLFFLLGKVLNALMLDKVEVEMDRVERVNKMLAAGTREFGPDFAERLGKAMGRPPYRPVQTVFVRPSEDLGKLAWDSVKRTKLAHQGGLMARWIRRSIEAEERFETGESDLASYVLFDPEYVQRAIDLGYRDAEAKHDELVDLFD